LQMIDNFEPLTLKTLSSEVAVLDLVPMSKGVLDGRYFHVLVGNCYGQRSLFKILRNQKFDPNLLKKISKEARSICHPNVRSYVRVCSAPENLMLVTEFLDANFDALPGKTYSTWTKIKMIKGVVAGVRYLYAKDPALVPRIVAENILFDDKSKTVKVDIGWKTVSQHTRVLESTTETDVVQNIGAVMFQNFRSEDRPDVLTRLINLSVHPILTLNKLYNILNQVLVEIAFMEDEVLKQFWTNNYPETTEVQISELVPALKKYLLQQGLTLNESWVESVKLGFAMLLNTTSHFGVISMEEFANLMKFFGPMKNLSTSRDFTTSQLVWLPFSDKMFSLFCEPWFHGETDAIAAETLLKETKIGTYLMRFSSTPGNYAVSCVVKDKGPVHIRIINKGATLEIILDDRPNKFIDEWDVLEFCKRKFNLNTPCPGSKYYNQFSPMKDTLGLFSQRQIPDDSFAKAPLARVSPYLMSQTSNNNNMNFDH